MSDRFDTLNSQRLFESLVSIEAWHSDFDVDKRANIYVDLAFGTARLGGEVESPVQFRLSLRRADVIFSIPENEPLEVLQDTVSREQSFSSGNLRKVTSEENVDASDIAFSGNVSRNPQISLSSSATGKNSRITSTIFETNDEVRLIMVNHFKEMNGNHRWELTPTSGANLQGRPWDALQQPRLAVKDKRRKPNHLEGLCRIDIRCKREDLNIESIRLKDKSLFGKISRRKFFNNKIAAAEAYIRKSLIERGLRFDDLESDYSDIYIVNAIVEPLVR